MDRQTFAHNLLIYGADFENWPPDLRAVAQQLVTSSEEYRMLLSQERGFEEGLLSLQVEPHRDNLEQAILAKALPREEETFVLWLKDLVWGSSLRPAALVVALVVGFYIGTRTPTGQGQDTSQQDLSTFFSLEGQGYL